MINPIYCAVDTPDVIQALSLANQLKGHVGGLKLGLEFFLANGADGYCKVATSGIPIFLDVKLHDIPNTVAGGIKSLLSLRPKFITLHTAGGSAMMRAAVEASSFAPERPKLLGVTVLTSLDQDDLKSVGQHTHVTEQVLRLAVLAKESGLDGVICSPAEVAILRQELGPDFILMVPGIRPLWAGTNDQKRVMGPREAMRAGATHLVIGRPITSADVPAQAAQRILEEI